MIQQDLTAPMTSPATPPLRFDIAALTDKGLKRSANEDAYGLFDLPQTDAAVVVADGMGGLQAGDIASEETVSVMEETLRERLLASDTPDAALGEAFVRANARVYAIAETVRRQAEASAKQTEADLPTAKRGDYSKSAPHPKSSTPLMGATCVAALFHGGRATIAHAGDSRLYRLRGGVLEALTFDHSFVAERVRSGDISEAEARVSRFRNMITRAVGIDDAIAPEIQTQTVVVGDVLLFCTDGLNTMIDDAQIASLLASGTASSGIAAQLVEAANRHGGSDNITVVVVRVLDPTGDAPVFTPLVQASASERPVSPPAEGRRPTNRPPVVDMENPPRAPPRPGASPVVALLAFFGVLSLGVVAACAASREMRQNIGRLLAPIAMPSPLPSAKGAQNLTGNTLIIKDYAKMTYKPPVSFGEKVFAVRGDILGYSPKAGLFFVKDTSGQLTYMTRDGNVATAAIGAEIAQPPPVGANIPLSRVFYATDLQGNSYVSYSSRKLILKYNKNGAVIGKIASRETPEALAVDEDGNIYVVYDSEIKKLEAIPITKLGAAAKPATSATP